MTYTLKELMCFDNSVDNGSNIIITFKYFPSFLYHQYEFHRFFINDIYGRIC